jgi:hypothetical protein
MSYLGYIPRTTRTSSEVPVTSALVASPIININYRVGYIDVYRNGIKLFNGPDYSATNGTSIVLNDAPAIGDDLEIVSYQSLDFNNAYGITGGTSSGSGSSSTGFSRIENSFNIASITSTLSVIYSTSDFLDVFKNGVKLSDGDSGTPADFTAAGSNTIGFSVPLNVGDIVEVVRYQTTGAGSGFTRVEFDEVVSAPTTAITFASLAGDYIDVYRNGIKLSDGLSGTPADYTVSTSAITFSFTLNPGDLIQIINIPAAPTTAGGTVTGAAPLDSPAFTGVPTAPDANNPSVSSQIATVDYVVALIPSFRALLAAPFTIFVASTGLDTNSGSSASPLLTLDAAWALAQNSFDLNGQVLTIQVEGAVTPIVYAGLTASGLLVGQSSAASVVITGDPAFPLGVETSIIATEGALITVENLIVSNTGISGSGLKASNHAEIVIGSGIEFGPSTLSHISAIQFGLVSSTSPYAIIGTGTAHWFVESHGAINIASVITISGTLSFTSGFAFAEVLSSIRTVGTSFVNTATFTGSSLYYTSSTNSVINTAGAGATFLPGNTAGVSITGLYI